MGVYLECIDDDSRSNFQFNLTGGTARAVYLATSPDGPVNVQQVQQEILGYTNPYFTLNSPALRRTLPVTHPRFPYLYATNISSMIGKGTGTAVRVSPTPPTNPTIGAKPIADYLAYRQYEVAVEFAARPYPVLADEAFTNKIQGSWTKKNGGEPETFYYSPEWVRWADFNLTPQDNTVQGQQGMFSLWGIPGPANANGVPFQNPPWMWLPDQLLTITWYAVPFRYITSANSYIAGTTNRNWRGRVNQNPFWLWPAGSLLYMGYSVQKYTPPTNDVGTYLSYLPTASSKSATGNTVLYERLCDITLTFLYTTRYLSGTLGQDIQNKNYVAAGHNLLPYLPSNDFRYATRTPLNATTGEVGTANVQNPPAWFSFPAEVLFSDPDASGGPTTTGDN